MNAWPLVGTKHLYVSPTGQYGEVPVPRPGQLLLADQTRGTAKRVRGYAVLTEKTLPTQEAGAFNG